MNNLLFILLFVLINCSINDIPNPVEVVNCWNGGDCYIEENPTHGNSYIYDRYGRIVMYHGFVSGGSSKSSPTRLPWQNFNDYKNIRDRGFNHLKLMFFWSSVEPERDVYDDVYIDGLLQHISWCDSLGIDVVLDFHKDIYGPYFGVESKSGIPMWATDTDSLAFNYDGSNQDEWGLLYLEPAVQEAFKNFWEGTEYKKKYIDMLRYLFTKIEERGFNNVIGLDPMNEPFPHNFKKLDGNYKDQFVQVLHDVKSADDFEKYYLAPFYENVKLMLEKEFNNKHYRLFFEPWMSTSSGYPSRIVDYYKSRSEDVYYPHLYLLSMLTGEEYGSSYSEKELKTNLEIKIIEAKRSGVPIMLGEFGADVRYTSSYKYIKDVLNIFTEYGIGWNYYTLEMIGISEYGVYNSDTSHNEMMNTLDILYVQRIAGIKPRFSNKDGYYYLSYLKTDVKEPTEIYIPSRYKNVKIIINNKEYLFDNSSNIFKYYNEEKGTDQIIQIWAN
jgi:endoglycosylceramidase